jgi:hypothetical protein
MLANPAVRLAGYFRLQSSGYLPHDRKLIRTSASFSDELALQADCQRMP